MALETGYHSWLPSIAWLLAAIRQLYSRYHVVLCFGAPSWSMCCLLRVREEYPGWPGSSLPDVLPTWLLFTWDQLDSMTLSWAFFFILVILEEFSFPPPRQSKWGITSRALTHSNMYSNMHSTVRGWGKKRGGGALFVCLFQNNYPREHSTGKRTNEMEKNERKKKKK